MGFKVIYFSVFLIACVSAQTRRVCILSSEPRTCQNLDRDDSQATCSSVESRVDCALRLERGTADFGVFTEEETMLLAQVQPQENRVVATIRNVQRNEPFAFEAVAVVRSNHTGGLEGLRGGRYCHPGLTEPDLRWSPRVLKTLERLAARTDRCQDLPTDGRTAEELEVETLNRFFSAACRPGTWSSNATHDADLKNRFPNLCSMCGENSNCERYTLNMGVNVAGVDNNNRHIIALECLRTNGTVSFVAWQHVREFFTIRNPDEASSFALLCEDGTLQALTPDALNVATSPCSFVRQPWPTVIASTATAAAVQASLRNWWPNGTRPAGTGWQTVLFDSIIGGANAMVVFEETLLSPLNFTSTVRSITEMDATTSCLPARRWCTLSAQEQTKCNWVKTAAFSLGIEPRISCQQRNNIFDCLRDIRESRADFIATPANYGFISRQQYQLSPVKLVQNSRTNPAAFSRVAALVKDSSDQGEITRFENLRDKKACFPEFGGIAFVAFVRAAHERSVISRSECDYARAVGEFFSGACAGGAIDATHAISETSTFNASTLCSVCRPANPETGNISDFTCAWDSTNLYFGNRGAVACLADPDTDVAFLELKDIRTHMRALNVNESHYRALCRNNSLALSTGVDIEASCLLADIVDSEVLSRRRDPILNSLNVLLDTLDDYFGYNSATGSQLINLEIYSPFDGVSDLLFKDTAIGISDPTTNTANEASRNYIELFEHLQSCTGSAPPIGGGGSRNMLSVLTFFVMALMGRVVIW